MTIHSVKPPHSWAQNLQVTRVTTTLHSPAGYADRIMLSSVEQLLTRLEGDAGWMHLDAGGRVRVGTGLLLPDSSAAEQLPFQLGTRAATRTEIAAEFRRVTNLPPRLPASFYRREHGPELEPEMIGALVRTILVGLQLQLRDSLPHFDQLAMPAQIALLSVGYTTGTHEALKQYPTLIRPQSPSHPPPAPPRLAPHRTAAVLPLPLPSPTPRPLPPQPDPPLRRLAFGLLGLGAAMLQWLDTP